MKNRLTTIEPKEVNVMVWEPNQNLTDFGSLLPSKQNDPDKQQDLVMEFVLNNYPNELTQKAIVTDLKQLNVYLLSIKKTLFTVKAYHLGLYRKHLVQSDYKIGSVNRKLASVKAFYRFLHETGHFDTNIALYLKLIKNVSKIGSTPAFSKADLQILFASFDEEKPIDLRDKLLFAIAFFCAARVSAIINLKFEDILQEASGLKLRLREKGGKIRYLHCNSQLLAPTLIKYLKTVDFKDGFVFRGYRSKTGFTDKQLDRSACHYMIKRRLRRLNLPQKFSFHSFRAAFATSWLESNLSIDALQKIGAWANLDTVKRYDRNTQEASISEMETMKI